MNRHQKLYKYMLLAQVASGFYVVEAHAASGALEEIVVTAQRREASLQEVPIAVSAFGEQALEDAGVQTVHSLGSITPGLHVGTFNVAITPIIRGVGTPSGTTGVEQAVATYVDGVFITNPFASIFDYNNIERIEVLKGPQGTLFGRNTTGGLIQVVTKDPSHDSELRSAISYGSYETVGAKFYGTTGVSDSVAADLAVIYKNQGEGYGDNLTTGGEVNKSESFGVRTKWLFELSDNTTIRLTGDYNQVKTSTGVYNANLPGSLNIDGQAIFGGCVAAIGGNPRAPTPEEFGICQPVAVAGATKAPEDWQDSFAPNEGIAEVEGIGFSARIDHKYGDVDIVSITSYRESSLKQDFDQAVSPFNLVDIHMDDASYTTISQEIQLLSTGENINWIVGAFFMADETGYMGPSGLGLSGPFIPVPGGINIFSDIDTNSYAVFGEVTYSLTDTTRLTGGLRWTLDEREHSGKQISTASGAALIASEQDDDWNEPTYRFILDHDLTEDIMVYSSYSRGFKSGGYNSSTTTSPAFDPETIDAYEIGLKSSLLDNRVRLNAAAFYYEYDDLQASKAVNGALVTINAAQAETKGFEVELMASATDRLDINAGVSYLDAEYTKFPDAPVYLPNTLLGGNVETSADVSGNALVKSPEWTFNLGGTYLLPIELHGGEMKFAANYYYNDGFYWEPSNRIKEDSYSLLHLGLSWRSADDIWGVRLYADNVLDEEYSMFTVEQAVGDLYEPAPPLTFGFEISSNF